MNRKTILILLVLTLIIGACSPGGTPTQETPVIEAEPTETQAPTVELATLTPEIDPATEMTPETLTFSDDLGRTINLSEPAQRIVTLGPSSLESLFAIGAGGQIVGREEFSTYPEEALKITSVGSLWGELPVEAILALEPDLIIAPEIIAPEQIQSLEDLGLTVYFQANPTSFEELWVNLRDLAALTGQERSAENLITQLDERVKSVQEVIATISYMPKVFYELDATDPQNPFTVGSETFIDTIITMAGGFNIGSILEGQYAPMSSEEIITQNPDIILLADAPYGISPESVAERAGWDAIQAVQNGAIYEFDPFLVSVPGPRLVDGFESMAQILHPEAFE
jgi:iron complex transport system substrate-binding protein